MSGEDFIENPTGHPIKTLQSFHEIAPAREVKYCNLQDVEGIISLNADCMYVSLEAKGNNSYWRKSIDSDLNEIPTIFVSAGNHGNEYKNSYMIPKNVYGASAVRVSPSEMRNGVPVPNATYSVIATNYSAKSEYVDFAGVTDLYLDDGYKFGGTSCACPVLVGMVALVNDFFIQKTGKPLSREKMYQFLQDCSIPETGDDPRIKTERIGWGLPILPNPETIDITKYSDIKQEDEDSHNMPQIVEKINTNNFTRSNRTPKYIVIHYFGDLGTAENTTKYFNNPTAKASAHYVLDEGNIIYHCVEDTNIAWHCGSKNGYVHPDCRNANSIGIEARPRKINKNTKKASDTDWYFDERVINNLVWLTKRLMKQYNIPIDRVIRHYDVTGKLCPRPMCGKDKNVYYKTTGDYQWELFKSKLTEDEDMITLNDFKKLMTEYRAELQDNDCSNWSKDAREWAIKSGVITGIGTDSKGQTNYAWGDQLTREQMVTMLYRFSQLNK